MIALHELTPAHLDDAVQLSRAAGWPHRREDWALALAIGTGVVALEHDRVVGTAMVTRYGAAVATISLVIVDAARRGRGIGRQLLDWTLREAGEQECRLVATPDGLPLYRQLGFQTMEPILQHQGTLGAVPPGVGVVWADRDTLPAVIALDRAAFGADRSKLIEALFQRGQVAMLAGGGGFAMVRPFGRGEVAGPVVASTLAEAQTLLATVFAARPGSFMRVDTRQGSGLAPWLAMQGLAQVDVETLMRRGTGPHEPNTAHAQSFALASHAHH